MKTIFSLPQKIGTFQSWFEIYKVSDETFAICEPGHWDGAISYLIEGHNETVLLDTGMGIRDIKKVIQTCRLHARMFLLLLFFKQQFMHACTHFHRLSLATDIALTRFKMRLFYSYRQTQEEYLGRERKRLLRRFRDGYHISQTRSHKRCIDVEVLESPLVMRCMAVTEILYSYLFTVLTMFHFGFIRALKI